MRVFIISGPPGSGKTTIANKLAGHKDIVLDDMTGRHFKEVVESFMHNSGSRIFVCLQTRSDTLFLKVWLRGKDIDSEIFNIQ